MLPVVLLFRYHRRHGASICLDCIVCAGWEQIYQRWFNDIDLSATWSLPTVRLEFFPPRERAPKQLRQVQSGAWYIDCANWLVRSNNYCTNDGRVRWSCKQVKIINCFSWLIVRSSTFTSFHRYTKQNRQKPKKTKDIEKRQLIRTSMQDLTIDSQTLKRSWCLADIHFVLLWKLLIVTL